MKKKNIFDYDNTIMNCDSEFLINFFLLKINVFNKNFKNINFFFYNLYEIKKLSILTYLNFINKFVKKINKILEIFFFIINIFKNKIFNFRKKSIISTSSYYLTLQNLNKIFNIFFICSHKKKYNLNEKKIINLKNLKKNFFFSDSINDINLLFYNKKKIIVTPDKILYKIFYNIKIINKNFFYN